MRTALLLALVLLAGCARPEAPETAVVDAPVGTAWAECPPAASRGIALAFRAESTGETGGRPSGIHRLDERSFLYVWASYVDTLREDRVTRVNPVELAVDGDGMLHLCTRVDVAAPTVVDPEPRTYGVGVLLSAEEPLPARPVRVVVNWVAGCPCAPLPHGNATAVFAASSVRAP